MSRRLFNWLFRNRQTNEITIGQFPNVSLWTFLVTVVLRWIVPDGAVHTGSSWVGAAALGWWSTDEVLRGVNPWRRLLGVAGCAFVVARVTSLLR
ncbi:MAG: hypothetical protein ABI658_32770 [Acidimicrobiales bacterium]